MNLTDTLGAFCPDNHAVRTGSGSGPLAGLSFAAKDALDRKSVV